LFEIFYSKVSPWWNICKKLVFEVCNLLYREPVAPYTAPPLWNRKSSVPPTIVPSGFSVSQNEGSSPLTSSLYNFKTFSMYELHFSHFKIIPGEWYGRKILKKIPDVFVSEIYRLSHLSFNLLYQGWLSRLFWHIFRCTESRLSHFQPRFWRTVWAKNSEKNSSRFS